jgi:hypothetical protein
MSYALASGIRGFEPAPVTVIGINRTGSTTTIGVPLKFDTAQSDGATTDIVQGSDASSLSNLIACDGNEGPEGIIVVPLQAVADNAELLVQIAGRVQGFTLTTLAKGTAVYAGAAKFLANTTNKKAVGLLLETVGGSDALAWMLFDGYHGFSNKSNS